MASLHSLLTNVRRDIASLMKEHHNIEDSLDTLENQELVSGVKKASLLPQKTKINKSKTEILNKIASLVKQASTLQAKNDRALRLMFLDGAYAYMSNPAAMEKLLDLVNELMVADKKNAQATDDDIEVDEQGNAYNKKRIEYAEIVSQLSDRANFSKYKVFSRGPVFPGIINTGESEATKYQINEKLKDINSLLDNTLMQASTAIDKFRDTTSVRTRQQFDDKVADEIRDLEKSLASLNKKKDTLKKEIDKVENILVNENEDKDKHALTMDFINDKFKKYVTDANELFEILEEGIKQLDEDQVDEAFLADRRDILKKSIESIIQHIDVGIRPTPKSSNPNAFKENDVTKLRLIIFLNRLVKKLNVNIALVSLTVTDYITGTQEDSLASIKYTPTGSFDNTNLSSREAAALKVKINELVQLGKGTKLGILQSDSRIFSAFKELTGFTDDKTKDLSQAQKESYAAWVTSWLGRVDQGWYRNIMSAISGYTKNLKTSYLDSEDVYQTLFFGVSKTQQERLRSVEESSTEVADFYIDPLFLAGLLTCSKKSRGIDLVKDTPILKSVVGVVGKEYLWSDKGNKLSFIFPNNQAILKFINKKTNKIAGSLIRKRSELTMYKIVESDTLMTPSDYTSYIEGLLLREGKLAKTTTPKEKRSLISKKREELKDKNKIKEIRVKMYEASIDAPITGQDGTTFDDSGAGRIEDVSNSLSDMGGLKGTFEYQDTLTSASIFDKGGYSINQIYLDMLSGDKTRLMSLVDSYQDRIVDLLNRNPTVKESLTDSLSGIIPDYVRHSDNLFTSKNVTFYRNQVRSRINSALIPKKRMELHVNKLKMNAILAAEEVFEGNDEWLRDELKKIDPQALSFAGLTRILTSNEYSDPRSPEDNKLVKLEKLLEEVSNQDLTSTVADLNKKYDEQLKKSTDTKYQLDTVQKLIKTLETKKDGKWDVSQIAAIRNYFKTPAFAYSSGKLLGLSDAEIFDKISNLEMSDLVKIKSELEQSYKTESEAAKKQRAEIFRLSDEQRALKRRQEVLNKLLDLSVEMGVSRVNAKDVIYDLKTPTELQKDLAIANSNLKKTLLSIASVEEQISVEEDHLSKKALEVHLEGIRHIEKRQTEIKEVLEQDLEKRKVQYEGESAAVKIQKALKKNRYEKILDQESFDYKIQNKINELEELRLQHFDDPNDEARRLEKIKKLDLTIKDMKIQSRSINVNIMRNMSDEMDALAKDYDNKSDLPKAQDNYKAVVDYLNSIIKKLVRFEGDNSHIRDKIETRDKLDNLVKELGNKDGKWTPSQYTILRKYLLENTNRLDNKTTEQQIAELDNYSTQQFKTEHDTLKSQIEDEEKKTEADTRDAYVSRYREMRKNAQDESAIHLRYASPKVIFAKIEELLKRSKDKSAIPALEGEFAEMTNLTSLGDDGINVKTYNKIYTLMESVWSQIYVRSAMIEKNNMESKLNSLLDKKEQMEEEKASMEADKSVSKEDMKRHLSSMEDLQRSIKKVEKQLEDFSTKTGISSQIEDKDKEASIIELVKNMEQYVAYISGSAPLLLKKVPKKELDIYRDIHRKAIKTSPNLMSLFEGRIETLRNKHVSVLYGDIKKKLLTDGLNIDSNIIKLHTISDVFSDYDNAITMNANIMASSEVIRNSMKHLLTSDDVKIESNNDALARKLWDFYFELIKVSGDEALHVKDIDDRLQEIDARISVNEGEIRKIIEAVGKDLKETTDPTIQVIVDKINRSEKGIELPKTDFNLDPEKKNSLISMLLRLKDERVKLLEERRMENITKTSLNGLRRLQNIWRISQIPNKHFKGEVSKTVKGTSGSLDVGEDKYNEEYYKNLLAILEGDVDPWTKGFTEILLEKRKEDARQDNREAEEDNADESTGSQFVNKRIATVVCEALRVFAGKSMVKNEQNKMQEAGWVEWIRKDPKKQKSIGATLFKIIKKAEEIRKFVLAGKNSSEESSLLNKLISLPTPKSLLSDTGKRESDLTQREKSEAAKNRKLSGEDFKMLDNYLSLMRPAGSVPDKVQEIMGERARAIFNPKTAIQSIYKYLPSLPVQFGFINETLSQSSDTLMQANRKKKAKEQQVKVRYYLDGTVESTIQEKRTRGKFGLTQLNALKGSFIGSSFSNAIAVAKVTDSLFDSGLFVDEIIDRYSGIGMVMNIGNKEAQNYFKKPDAFTMSDFNIDIRSLQEAYRMSEGIITDEVKEITRKIITSFGEVTNEKDRDALINLNRSLIELGKVSPTENTDGFLRQHLGMGNTDIEGNKVGFFYDLYKDTDMLSPEAGRVMSQLNCFFIQKKKGKTKPICLFNMNKIPKNLKTLSKVRIELLALTEKYENEVVDLNQMIKAARIEKGKTGTTNKRDVASYIASLVEAKRKLVRNILDIKYLLDKKGAGDYCNLKIAELNREYAILEADQKNNPLEARADTMKDIELEIRVYNEEKSAIGKYLAVRTAEYEDIKKKEIAKYGTAVSKLKTYDLEGMISEVNTKYTSVFNAYNLIDPSIVQSEWNLVKQEKKLREMRIPITFNLDKDINVNNFIEEDMKVFELLLTQEEKDNANIQKILRERRDYIARVYKEAIVTVALSLNGNREYEVDLKSREINRILYVDEMVSFFASVNPVIDELYKLKQKTDSIINVLTDVLPVLSDYDTSDKNKLYEIVKNELVRESGGDITDEDIEDNKEYQNEIYFRMNQIMTGKTARNENFIRYLKEAISEYGGSAVNFVSAYANESFSTLKKIIQKV